MSTADIAVPAGVPGLPGDTLLAFFYDADEQQGWGDDPGDRQFWTVIPVAVANATPVAAPPGTPTFPAYRMLTRTVTTIPDLDEPALSELDADYEDIERLDADLTDDDQAPWHRMLGWPDLVQNPMEPECRLAAKWISGGDSEGCRGPRVADTASEAADWLLLLQLDTDDEIGWMWGDGGTLYYWILRQDLLAGRFDRTWMILQCC